MTMAFQKDEKYQCPDTNCGCEIEVRKGAAPGRGGILPLAAVVVRRCRRSNECFPSENR
jgi:hypothetical protein